MKQKTIDLYIGFPFVKEEKLDKEVHKVLKERHPGYVLTEIVDGYWSGVQESTYLIQVETTLEHVQETAKIIKSLLANGFVALDEGEET